MGLDRAPIEFQTFYFSHVLVVPPTVGSSHLVILCDGAEIPLLVKVAKRTVGYKIQINNNLQGYSAIMGFHPINISRSESGKIRKVGGMYMSFIASGHPQ